MIKPNFSKKTKKMYTLDNTYNEEPERSAKNRHLPPSTYHLPLILKILKFVYPKYEISL